eukprot:617463-Lingulodinium_polyedra.AAC.1
MVARRLHGRVGHGAGPANVKEAAVEVRGALLAVDRGVSHLHARGVVRVLGVAEAEGGAAACRLGLGPESGDDEMGR